MKTNELNMNEMEQVNGGSFFADLEEVLRKLFHVPANPTIPGILNSQELPVGRGKC